MVSCPPSALMMGSEPGCVAIASAFFCSDMVVGGARHSKKPEYQGKLGRQLVWYSGGLRGVDELLGGAFVACV
jgi:hypothetical protein